MAVVIPLDDCLIIVGSLHCAVLSSRGSEFPKPSTRSPGVNSWSVAQGWASDSLLARSASGVAPGCDKGGWGALRSLDIGLFVM
jgi:hypothetical protein